eukprot:Seg6828.3 transcript_id=Seg6828.3/GoldUCD/mRNA.D3Y31 product="hypothetical protein" protein_id=Seg6828.3/GoldUCD/D3Y31
MARHLANYYDAERKTYNCQKDEQRNSDSDQELLFEPADNCDPNVISSDSDGEVDLSFLHNEQRKTRRVHRHIPNVNDSDKRACFENKDCETNSDDDDNSDEEIVWIDEEEVREIEDDLEAENVEVPINADSIGSVLLRWLCIFIAIWQMKNVIPDTAIGSLLKFLGNFFFIIASRCDYLEPLARNLPTTVDSLLLSLGMRSIDNFKKYAVCPRCFKLYELDKCYYVNRGIRYSRKCNFIDFDNHRLAHLRKECGAELLKIARSPSGKRTLVPFKLYCYKSLKGSLEQLTKRKDFQKMCQSWRERNLPDGIYEDVYDGSVWKEFREFFSDTNSNIGIMLNLDWFNPYKHASYSIGAIYTVCLNLPRTERFKEKNVILVGIIPHMKHEPATNMFLEPLVKELKEGWHDGFMLECYGCAEKQKIRVALLCVGCDIPACRKLCGFLGKNVDV